MLGEAFVPHDNIDMTGNLKNVVVRTNNSSQV